jgi:ankyrin repeat protein
VAEWKKYLQIHGAGRNSRKWRAVVVGKKLNGKAQLKINMRPFFRWISHVQFFRLAAVIMVALAWSSLVCYGQDTNTISTTTDTNIFDAVRNDDLARVQALLKDNPNLVKSKDTYGLTPLFWAADQDHNEVAALLLTNGADVNATNAAGDSALIMAAYNNYTNMVELLLANQANVNATNKNGDTALLLAAYHNYTNTVELLLAKQANINAADTNGDTALHFAAAAGDADMVDLLLTNQADVNAKNRNGATPLYSAAVAFGVWHVSAAESLLAHGADVNATNKDGFTPLHGATLNQSYNGDMVGLLQRHGGVDPMSDIFEFADAASMNEVEKVKMLLTKTPALVFSRDSDGDTPLHLAARSNSKDVAELLLANQADVNATNFFDRQTPFDVACVYGSKEVADVLREHGGHSAASPTGIAFIDAVHDGDLDRVRALLKENPALAVGTNMPLFDAVRYYQKDVAELLLANQADVNATNNTGDTPLHLAAFGGDKDMTAMLLAYHANVNATNNTGETPLHVAAYKHRKDVVALLLAGGAKVDAITWGGDTPLYRATLRKGGEEVAALLRANGADVNAKANGWTILHVLGKNDPEMTEFLRQHGGLDVLATTGSAINDAVRDGDEEKVMALLKTNPALISSRDKDGDTPLHFAALNNDMPMIQLLLTNGADVNAVDYQGKTPLLMAVILNRKDAVELLLANGAYVNVWDNDGDTPLSWAAGDKEMVQLLNQRNAEMQLEAQGWIELGLLLAKQQDYLDASQYFQNAQKLAPDISDIYGYLGLVESKIPGRELRAIAWFGAYLAATTNAPNANAVRAEIAELQATCQTNTSRLIKSIETAAMNMPDCADHGTNTIGYQRDYCLMEVGELYVAYGDFDSARRIAQFIHNPDPALNDSVQSSIRKAQETPRKNPFLDVDVTTQKWVKMFTPGWFYVAPGEVGLGLNNRVFTKFPHCLQSDAASEGPYDLMQSMLFAAGNIIKMQRDIPLMFQRQEMQQFSKL